MFNLDDYETVEERLVKFWKDNPDGRVDTKLLDFNGGRYIVQAYIYRTFADSAPWSSGLAEETVAGRGVNSTSALENCETSAIGRALASASYATKGKRPSREEMEKVERYEKNPRKHEVRTLTLEELTRIEKVLEEIYAINEIPVLRKIWTDEKDFLDYRVKGTTLKDALNKRVQELSE